MKDGIDSWRKQVLHVAIETESDPGAAVVFGGTPVDDDVGCTAVCSDEGGNKTGGKRFPKGHKYAKGGSRKGAGRKTNETREINRIAAEIARDYIENTVKPLMETYLGLAAGVVVKRNGKEFTLVVDPATTRDAVAKLLPAARQEIDLQTHGTVIVKTNVDPYAGRKKN